MADVYCETCQELTHTSPTQVFWRCRWHCEEPGGSVTRCHVLPHSPACVHYVPRVERVAGELTGPAAFAASEIRRGVPVWAALSAAGLGVAS